MVILLKDKHRKTSMYLYAFGEGSAEALPKNLAKVQVNQV